MLTNLKILIAIPSHHRLGEVSSIVLFPTAKLFVEESQVADYRKIYDKVEVIAHPDSVRGLTPKLNWMMKYAREQKYDVFVKADDDLEKFMCLSEKRDELGWEELYQLIESWSVMCMDSGTNLFTVMETADVRKYESTNPFHLFSPIRIGFYGVILKDGQWFDERLVLKQDIDFALQTVYKYRHFWIDRRYSFTYRGTMTNKGGVSLYRNTDSENDSIETLKKKWGSYLFSSSQNARVGKMTVNVKNPLV